MFTSPVSFPVNAPATSPAQSSRWSSKQPVVLEARNLGLTLRDKEILADINLKMTAGTVWGLLGCNGAGKSTLLNLLNGDLAPSKGEVAVQGRPLAQWKSPTLAQFRAYLPQQAQLNFGFTVREVVEMGRSPFRTPQADPAIIREVLELTGMAPLAERSYLQLSGGEKQRTHWARVLAQLWAPSAAHPHRLLFLDEPVSSLDVRHQLQLLDFVRSWAHQNAVCVVLVLHNLNLAQQFCDRLVLLKQGRLLGTPCAPQELSEERLCELYDLSPAQLKQVWG